MGRGQERVGTTGLGSGLWDPHQCSRTDHLPTWKLAKRCDDLSKLSPWTVRQPPGMDPPPTKDLLAHSASKPGAQFSVNGKAIGGQAGPLTKPHMVTGFLETSSQLRVWASLCCSEALSATGVGDARADSQSPGDEWVQFRMPAH